MHAFIPQQFCRLECGFPGDRSSLVILLRTMPARRILHGQLQTMTGLRHKDKRASDRLAEAQVDREPDINIPMLPFKTLHLQSLPSSPSTTSHISILW